MGSPVSDRVAYSCSLDRNEGFFHPPILHYFAMGHPMGRVWFSSHSIETKFSLDNWSVFLQYEVPLVGSDSNDLISIEGITSVGLLGVFFRAVLGMFGHPVVVRLALKLGEFPHSAVFTSGADSVCVPQANEGVGLGPSSSGTIASRPPLGIGLLWRPRCNSSHLGVFMCWYSTHVGLASGSSGSQTSRYGLLVYVQGASDSLPYSSSGSEVVASGFWHSGTGVDPGDVPSSRHGCLPGAGSEFVRLYLLRIVSLSLRILF